jgi:hypothetical protein
MRICVVIALLAACAVTAFSQQLSSQARAQAIAQAFTKHKHAVKEKYGVRVEKYKDVKSEPAVNQNTGDYSGTYEVSGADFVITIQAGSDGRVGGNGSENGRVFKLENARIEAALLTASKVYQNGAREKFEGVFLKRTDRNSPTDAGVSTFGLGVLLDTPIELNGNTFEKLFYELKR